MGRGGLTPKNRPPVTAAAVLTGLYAPARLTAVIGCGSLCLDLMCATAAVSLTGAKKKAGTLPSRPFPAPQGSEVIFADGELFTGDRDGVVLYFADVGPGGGLRDTEGDGDLLDGGDPGRFPFGVQA